MSQQILLKQSLNDFQHRCRRLSLLVQVYVHPAPCIVLPHIHPKTTLKFTPVPCDAAQMVCLMLLVKQTVLPVNAYWTDKAQANLPALVGKHVWYVVKPRGLSVGCAGIFGGIDR